MSNDLVNYTVDNASSLFGKGSLYSTVGGLVGVVLSEGIIHYGQNLHGFPPNQDFRMAYDSIGFMIFSGMGSVAAVSKIESENGSSSNGINLIDKCVMIGNALVPISFGVYKLLLWNFMDPYLK